MPSRNYSAMLIYRGVRYSAPRSFTMVFLQEKDERPTTKLLKALGPPGDYPGGAGEPSWIWSRLLEAGFSEDEIKPHLLDVRLRWAIEVGYARQKTIPKVVPKPGQRVDLYPDPPATPRLDPNRLAEDVVRQGFPRPRVEAAVRLFLEDLKLEKQANRQDWGWVVARQEENGHRLWAVCLVDPMNDKRPETVELSVEDDRILARDNLGRVFSIGLDGSVATSVESQVVQIMGNNLGPPKKNARPDPAKALPAAQLLQANPACALSLDHQLLIYAQAEYWAEVSGLAHTLRDLCCSPTWLNEGQGLRYGAYDWQKYISLAGATEPSFAHEVSARSWLQNLPGLRCDLATVYAAIGSEEGNPCLPSLHRHLKALETKSPVFRAALLGLESIQIQLGKVGPDHDLHPWELPRRLVAARLRGWVVKLATLIGLPSTTTPA